MRIALLIGLELRREAVDDLGRGRELRDGALDAADLHLEIAARQIVLGEAVAQLGAARLGEGTSQLLGIGGLEIGADLDHRIAELLGRGLQALRQAAIVVIAELHAQLAQLREIARHHVRGLAQPIEDAGRRRRQFALAHRRDALAE